LCARWEFPQTWESSEAKEEGYVRNIGANGCFVQSSRKVPVGTPILLNLQLSTGEWLPVMGLTQHRVKSGFGLRFVFTDGTEQGSVSEKLKAALKLS
jgi:hypothetical protein